MWTLRDSVLTGVSNRMTGSRGTGIRGMIPSAREAVLSVRETGREFPQALSKTSAGDTEKMLSVSDIAARRSRVQYPDVSVSFGTVMQRTGSTLIITGKK